jgi:hypothetical protein
VKKGYKLPKETQPVVTAPQEVLPAKKTGNKANHYIDNAEFLRQLVEYFEKCDAAKKIEGSTEPPIPNYIGECFLKIATNVSRMQCFARYSFRDEMIMDGVENCLQYFRNFDPKIGTNPFSYFTQIVYFAFIRRINKEKKQSYIKYKLAEQSGYDPLAFTEDNPGSDDSYQNTRAHEPLYENMAEFIHDFEVKVEEKKNKRQKTAKKLPDKKVKKK